MPRALTAAHVIVSPGREAEYLGLLNQLAARLTARGQHLWVFRHPEQPGAFLEFSESASGVVHRFGAGQDAAERALEDALGKIVTYAPDRRVLWQEVSLEER